MKIDVNDIENTFMAMVLKKTLFHSSLFGNRLNKFQFEIIIQEDNLLKLKLHKLLLSDSNSIELLSLKLYFTIIIISPNYLIPSLNGYQKTHYLLYNLTSFTIKVTPLPYTL
jgi:hypothetical protein